MALNLDVFPIPSGGAIGIKITTAVSGAVTLSRATSGASGLSAWSQLYSGAPFSDTGEQCFYLDIGDQTPGPLQGGVMYVYQLTDISGSKQSNPVIPASNITVEETQYTQMLIRLLQGAINAASLPAGYKRPRVLNAMPLAGSPPLPLIVLNPELVAQQEIPIGADNEIVGDLIQPGRVNIWTQTEQDHHMFRITVFALSPEERDYYRMFIIAILRISVAYAFSQFGADTSRDFEAVSYQEVDQASSMTPGFYASDILFSFTATGNVKVVTNYDIIETITGDFDASLADQPTVDVQVIVPHL
jgi:hypothetical protein